MLEQDYFFLIEKRQKYQDDLIELLTLPTNARKVIVNENNIKTDNIEFEKILSNIIEKENLEVVNNVLEIEDLENVDRIIYVIKEGITSRQWYNKQRRFGENNNIPIVVLQVNGD